MKQINSIKDIRIIIVEDVVTFREILSSILRDLGVMHITEAVNGQEALEKIVMAHKGNENFDLIISDINMPKMTGIELLKSIRGYKKLGKIPFILVSTENDHNIILEALLLEISDYLIKPYDKELAAKKILKILHDIIF